MQNEGTEIAGDILVGDVEEHEEAPEAAHVGEGEEDLEEDAKFHATVPRLTVM